MHASQIIATRQRVRAQTEGAMLDRCVIERVGGEPTLDEDTAILEPAVPTTVYAGCCRFRTVPTANGFSVNRERADTVLTVTDYELVVPFDKGPFQIGDTVRFTRLSDPCVDPSGSWRVTAVPQPKWQVQRRLVLAEVTDRG